MPITKAVQDKKWIELEKGSMLFDEYFDDVVTVIMDDETQVKNCHFTKQATIIFRSKKTLVSSCAFDDEAVFVGAYEGEPQLYDKPVIEGCYFKKVALIGKPVAMFRNITGGCSNEEYSWEG